MTDIKNKILIVDDEPINLRALGSILSEHYEVIVAKNGKQALNMAITAPVPDLILLDIIMPVVDGYEVCRQLKRNPITQHIPIIFVSAMDTEIDEAKGFELGAVDYIAKPICPSIVFARVKTQLKLTEAYKKLEIAYNELEQKNKALEEMAVLRENVGHITRHDLKNPLNGIISATSLLMEEIEDEVYKTILSNVEMAGYQMLDMINSSLDLYKMEVKTYNYNPDQVDVITIFKKIISETKVHMDTINITVEILVNGKILMEGDSFLIQGEYLLCYSMLANLFKNAIEASPKDSVIKILLDYEEKAVIKICNQGVIPIEIRSTFFDKFVTKGKNNGTGLGTYSAKLMAETQHGTIHFDTSNITNTTTLTLQFLIFNEKQSQP
ncbi:MAG: hybrid sensor histidine kinase/response regulator [Candidatus Marithrix sp.]|nr:hybrid sensor histidine kinase/response regulator [Candidatus Marithrix sp.]